MNIICASICLGVLSLLLGCSSTSFKNSEGLFEYRTNMYEPESLGILVKEVDRQENFSIIQIRPDHQNVPPALIQNSVMYTLMKLGKIRGFTYGGILRPNPAYVMERPGLLFIGFANEAHPDFEKLYGRAFLSGETQFVELSTINFPPPWDK